MGDSGSSSDGNVLHRAGKGVTTFWNFVDDRSVVRRVVLFVCLWMTWRAFAWAADFAVTTEKPGLDAAAIIGAVTAPISVLQGFVFKVYSDGRV